MMLVVRVASNNWREDMGSSLGSDILFEIYMTCVGHCEIKPPIYEKFTKKNKFVHINGSHKGQIPYDSMTTMNEHVNLIKLKHLLPNFPLNSKAQLCTTTFILKMLKAFLDV